jgi:hypothetical protein
MRKPVVKSAMNFFSTSYAGLYLKMLAGSCGL